ncbi:MAG: FHA domain-containing protein [Myxococcota bacterium]|nr:FHA domain-containing protein [Myxococcota bacterium]MDW8361523.1 FHA domain-containing protein [Myxococcales bacterium]
MIICPRCNRENQDHYKFCLGCGAELPRDTAHAPKNFRPPTPPSGFARAGSPAAGASPVAPTAVAPASPAAVPSFGGAPVVGGPAPAPAPSTPAAPRGSPRAVPAVGTGQPAPAPVAAAAGADRVDCPQCGTSNPRAFKFCGSCGFNLQEWLASSTAVTGPPAAVVATAPTPPAQPAAAAAAAGSLVHIRPDGTEGESYPLGSAETVIGRESGRMFAADSYLSPRHATFRFVGQELVVRDENSLNGIYYKIAPQTPHELVDGTVFRIGQEIIRFERLAEPTVAPDGTETMGSPHPGYVGRIALVIGRETTANAYCVPPDGLYLGRERGDILFPDDGYVSGLHCRIHVEGGRVVLTDVGSSNGTFVRVRGQATVRSGTLLLMGQQLFRVEY